jgi:predicted permease
VETFVQDIRYGLPMLRTSPGFTALAVITLALGIGANTAIFSVVNGALLNPLPFPNARRIVSMFQDQPNFPKGSISYPNFLDWQRDNHAFASIAAFRWTDGSITGLGPAEEGHAQKVSATFFPILGVKPILGRNFDQEEDRRGAGATAIISEGLWRRKFGSDPDIIGKRVIVSGVGRTIIGVIPASFRLHTQNFSTADLYEPIGGETNPGFYRRDSFWGLDAMSGLAAAYAEINATIKATIIGLKDEMVGETRPMLLLLLGAVALVLLISCANVASLLLARSCAREREFSVRVALGAGPSRILRQLLTESLVLASLGGLLGLSLAKWGTSAAISAVPTAIPGAEEIGLNLRVLCFTLAISALTGVVFGLVPALKTRRAGMNETLKDVGGAVTRYRSRAQTALVIGEMAMALVLHRSIPCIAPRMRHECKP